MLRLLDRLGAGTHSTTGTFDTMSIWAVSRVGGSIGRVVAKLILIVAVRHARDALGGRCCPLGPAGMHMLCCIWSALGVSISDNEWVLSYRCGRLPMAMRFWEGCHGRGWMPDMLSMFDMLALLLVVRLFPCPSVCLVA